MGLLDGRSGGRRNWAIVSGKRASNWLNRCSSTKEEEPQAGSEEDDASLRSAERAKAPVPTRANLSLEVARHWRYYLAA